MFIALTRDASTEKAIRCCLIQFPDERARTLKQILRRSYDLTNLEEQPITRITIIGHAHNNVYGGMHSEVFAEHISQILKNNEERSPGFVENLKAIDLLGCELGFINPATSSYAFEVAAYLQKKGYAVPIYSFTIPSHSQGKFIYTRLHHESENTWGFYGFQSIEETKNFHTLITMEVTVFYCIQEKQTELYCLLEKIRKINYQITDLQVTIEQGSLTIKTYNQQLNHSSAAPFKVAKNIALEREKIARLHRNLHQNIALRSLVYAKKNAAQEHIVALEKHMLELLDQKNKCSEQIAQTTDFRDYFSAHSECNFTLIVQQCYPKIAMDNLFSELQTLGDKIEALEIQNQRWQQSLYKASTKLLEKKATIHPLNPEELAELSAWEQEYVDRELAIANHSAVIQSLLEKKQNLAKKIKLIQSQQPKISSPSKKGSNNPFFGKKIPREPIDINNTPLTIQQKSRD